MVFRFRQRLKQFCYFFFVASNVFNFLVVFAVENPLAPSSANIQNEDITSEVEVASDGMSMTMVSMRINGINDVIKYCIVCYCWRLAKHFFRVSSACRRGNMHAILRPPMICADWCQFCSFKKVEIKCSLAFCVFFLS